MIAFADNMIAFADDMIAFADMRSKHFIIIAYGNAFIFGNEQFRVFV